jgi:hypothetical protein
VTIRDEQSLGTTLSTVPAAAGYAPDDQTVRMYDLTSDPNNLYIGYGTQGADPTKAVWTIRRIALSSGSPTQSNWTAKGAAVWTNRATESYL